MTEKNKYLRLILDENDRLRRHFHVNFYLGNDETMEQDDLFHEGVAYDNEEYWALFYDDGILFELPELKNNEKLIMIILKKDISDKYNDILELFKNWVTQKLGEIATH